MVSTRTATKQQQQAEGSPLDGDARKQRMQRQLQIDGKDALRGGKIERPQVTVRKQGGASYEVEADGISWARTGMKRPAGTAAPSSAPAPKRRRPSASRQQQAEAGLLTSPPKDRISATTGKKRKLKSTSAASDVEFLAETIHQLKRVKVPDSSSRQAEIRMMLPYLKELRPRSRQHVRRQAHNVNQPLEDAPDAYELDAVEARRFLRSTTPVDAPVFVAGDASAITDPESNARPIDQFLEWLSDRNELYTTDDLGAPEQNGSIPSKIVAVSEIKQRFRDDQKHQCPWNLPDIPFPFPAPAVPDWLRAPTCNLHSDIMRYLQDIEHEDVCTAACQYHDNTAEKCLEHFLTAEELVDIQKRCREWQGTVMLAKPGAITPPHYDTFGFSTLISCYEGEIGFSWLSNPTEDERLAAHTVIQPSSRWCYRILRPSDCVYMSPGTRHLVFRLPEGAQTLATAVRALRYCDIAIWVEILKLELRHTVDKEEYVRVARGLAMGARHLIDQAKARNDVGKFGGQQEVEAAEKLLSNIEERL